MKCSRVALSLLLAALGCVVIALTPTDGRRGVAADIEPTPPIYLNPTKEEENRQGAYDQGDYIYNSDEFTQDDQAEYDTNANADYEYDADESMYGRESHGYPNSEYTADREFGYSDSIEDEADAEIDAEVHNEMYDVTDDEVDDEMYDEIYDVTDDGVSDEMDSDDADDKVNDEMNNETDNETADETDNETADEGNDHGYEYAYPESQYGYSRGIDEYFQEEISSDRETEDSASKDPTSDDYSCYDECGHDSGDWNAVDEAEGAWTKDGVDAVEADCVTTDTTPTDTHFGQYERWDSEPGEVSEDGLEDESADYDYEYEYAEPDDCYGDLYIEPMSAAPRKQGLELFAWGPAEVLLDADCEILMSLERLCEEPSGARRAALNEHIECCGMEAIDFVTRFEDSTGIEVLGLADDLPGCAALLATFRLLEMGELNVEEAVDLLRRSMTCLSQQWIEGVSEITANAFEETDESRAPAVSAGRPLFGTVISMAAQSLDDLGGAICGLSRRLDALKGRF